MMHTFNSFGEIDGVEVAFSEGETILEVAQRHQNEIPTLCYDPRLEPFGGCRLCIVELEGARNPVASCYNESYTWDGRPYSDRYNRGVSEDVARNGCR